MKKFLPLAFFGLLLVLSVFLLIIYGCGSNPTGGGTTSYTLTITVTPEGWGTVEADPAGGTYPSGTNVQLTATGLGGHIFGSWEGDVAGNTTPTDVVMNSTKNIFAVFRAPTTNYYPLTTYVSPDGSAGSVTLDPPGGSYLDGTYVTLTASPSANYVFDQWSGDITSASNPVMIEVNGTKEITAEFFPPHTINVTISPSATVGAVTLDPPSGPYAHGSSVTLTASSNTGYAFSCWEGDISSVLNPVTITVNATLDITAEFIDAFEFVGNPNFTPLAAAFLSLYVYGGTPYLAYRDHDFYPTVMKFNGSSWVQVGSIISTDTAMNVSLSIDTSGTPYVVYTTGFSESGTIKVWKFNGSIWVQVGSSLGTGSYPSIFVDGTTPYVSFRDSSNKATVKKYSGSWSTVGWAGFSEDEVNPQKVALYVYSGTPYVFYTNLSSYTVPRSVVKRYYSSTWEVVGNSNFVDGTTENALYVYSGTPYVAYKDFTIGQKIIVRKLNASTWNVVGTAGFSDGSFTYLGLQINSTGTPYVAFRDSVNDDGASVMKFNGSAWEYVGPPGFESGYQLSFFLYNGMPYIAFAGSGSKANVMKFNH